MWARSSCIRACARTDGSFCGRGQDVRRLERLAPPIDVVVADLAFIRLRDVMPALTRAAPQAGWILALLKPQFELPGRAVPRDGIVKDAGQRQLALDAFTAWCATAGTERPSCSCDRPGRMIATASPLQ